MVRTRVAFAVTALTLVFAGCSFAPKMTVPEVPTADTYKELGPWKEAQPADRLPRDSWWLLYETPEIDTLEKELIAGNPTLAASLANYNTARALTDEARAGLFPTLGATAAVSRNRESVNAPLIGATAPRYYDDNTAGGTASYELDLWGQIRNQVAQARANAQASAADLENARLALLAQLIGDYIQLRSFDREQAILDDTVKAYDRALTLTQQRHDAGIAAGLDVAQAQTQLSAARSEAAQVLAQRAGTEHAIAALLGISASSFNIAPAIVDIKLPQVPMGMPTTLLERRPDIAGAQRRMIAANANIGVARAAYFPSLTLGAQGGYQSNKFSNWISAPSTFWAVGPNAVLSVFDGGLRRAQVRQARAEFDSSAANYRSVVVTAFQQVEDSLANLNHYDEAAKQEKDAVAAAQRTLDFSMILYKQGATDYLNVVTSQTALLQAQLTALNLDTLQLQASVDLVRALGGGWEDSPQMAARLGVVIGCDRLNEQGGYMNRSTWRSSARALALLVTPACAAFAAAPDYKTIVMQIDVDRPAAQVWAKVGKYCDISQWLNLDCTITQGAGEIGTVRALAGGRVLEILVGKTDLSYGYTQPVKEGEFYSLYHGFMEAKPVTAKTSKIVYTLIYDISDKPDQAAKDADIARRRSAFEAALKKMKEIAEH